MNQPQRSEINADAFINLHRPLIFLDLETTGTDSQHDRIVELSAIKLHPDRSQESLYYLLNPGKHISDGASKIHGFTDEDVADQPKFCEVANEIFTFFDTSGIKYACYGAAVINYFLVFLHNKKK